MVFKCFLEVVAQAVFQSDESRFQSCGPATENALEPTDVDTYGVSYCSQSADCR